MFRTIVAIVAGGAVVCASGVASAAEKTWQNEIERVHPQQLFYDVDAGARNNVWAVGPNVVLRSQAKGVWNEVGGVTTRSVYAVSAAGSSGAWFDTGAPGKDALVRYGTSGVTTTELPAGTWVDAIQANGSEVYVAGHVGGAQGNPFAGTSYLKAFDGTSWRDLALPSDVALYGFTRRTGSDVWAFGTTKPGRNPVTLHWDGSSWTRVPVPDTGIALLSGASVNSKQAWAVGMEWDYDDTGRPVLGQSVTFRWNGTDWSRVSLPFEVESASHVASDGDGGAWLGRYDSETVLHYRNGSWTATTLPSIAGRPSGMQDITAIPGTKDNIAVSAFLTSGPPTEFGTAVVTTTP
jgi:hypothetical protein